MVEVDAYVDAANVRIEVTDGGGTTVPHRRNDPDGEHGRGLPILAMLTRSWGFEQLDDGRLRVWFEVPHTAVPNPRNAAGSESLQGTPSAPRTDDGNHESSTANHAAHVNDR